jgi:2-keto-3-deoxy-L-rhamnonate aldolase RhmA
MTVTTQHPLRRNRLRELLDEGKPTLGTHLLTTWPTVTEIVGQTGQWDYVEFVAEYAPWTMHDLDNLGRAVELFPDFTAMIKIEQDTRGHLAMRAIGSGIQNVLFSDVRTRDDAVACVRAVRPEHPDHGGLHGVGMRRDARTVIYPGSAQWMESLCNCVVALMIEKKQTIDNLKSILAVNGIDMIQFGPADYAMSVGMERTDDGVRETETYVIETAHKMGVPARAELRDVENVERYLALGVRHFCVGHDVGILHDWYTEQGKRMRDALAEGGLQRPEPRDRRSLY